MRRHQDGKIFLIDFGAVKELASLMVNAQGELLSSIVIGTPGYMPNEQKNGKPCLVSDVYALGMNAIQAITGILPVNLLEDPQTGELIWRHQAQVSRQLRMLRGGSWNNNAINCRSAYRNLVRAQQQERQCGLSGCRVCVDRS